VDYAALTGSFGRKRSYESDDVESTEGPQRLLVMEELSPRARRLVEGGVIDLDVIAGSGPGGQITSGDILHAARIMEVEQSVARIETMQGHPDAGDEVPESVAPTAEALSVADHVAGPG
jgi:pyruvate/2-oxoglutarate dehydrogenase complex dihydrolipoamide acyltransferase (E2) component